MLQKYALISVSDKTGVASFAKELFDLGYNIISTGGTKAALEKCGINCISISDVTGFPEVLDGRVKTLHPNVHAGLLAVRDNAQHIETMTKHNINFIDIVVVNLYPFKQTVASGASKEEIIENIDIGGPSMLRSAAKNHKFVTVVCDNADYDQIISQIKQNGNTTLQLREILAAKVFRHTASYDAAIASYLTQEAEVISPESLTLSFDLISSLRYGENPHQKAAFYRQNNIPHSLAQMQILNGKELSYNNILDANAALEIIREFELPTAVALKHNNPCGVASSDNIFQAYKRCYQCDPVSIFGGIVAVNGTVDKLTAEEMVKTFLEVVIAPDFDADALQVLFTKKNLRVIKCRMQCGKPYSYKKYTSVMGGLLVQDADMKTESAETCRVVTKISPTPQQLKDMLYLQKIVKHVKSNAIVVGCNNMLLGVGAGQMNRIGSAQLALAQAEGKSENLVLASDAFFPFDDCVSLAHKYGIKAIIQPGGSVNDHLSISKCDELGIAMVFTDVRHFKH